MGKLISIEKIDNFKGLLDFAPTEITEDALVTIRKLDERTELEPFIRAILLDVNNTPHGPVEIVDILTHKLSLNGEAGIAAFILKGKGFPIVRPQHVAHQIYRLEKIADLSFAFLVTTGTVLDQAKEQFIATASRVANYYCIIDAFDLARLFIGYGFICPRDGHRIAAGRCICGYSPRKRILNILQEQTLKDLATAHTQGQSAGLVILPTGSGKTRIAAEDAKRFGATSILYIAHTHEILDVAESEFAAVFGQENVTRCKEAPGKQSRNIVNIATIQLIRGHMAKFGARDFDYIIVDEFHHVASRSYRELLERIRPKFLLGLTATPFRGDRQDITKLCQSNIIANYD
ncbi:MAG TPA: DEAD/DEAH box helicase family protein [Thermoanaerobaculia bacterium]|jgi:hypothetical protein